MYSLNLLLPKHLPARPGRVAVALQVGVLACVTLLPASAAAGSGRVSSRTMACCAVLAATARAATAATAAAPATTRWATPTSMPLVAPLMAADPAAGCEPDDPGRCATASPPREAFAAGCPGLRGPPPAA